MNQTSGAALNFDDNSGEQEVAYEGDYLISFTDDGVTVLTEIDDLYLDMSE